MPCVLLSNAQYFRNANAAVIVYDVTQVCGAVKQS